MHIPHVYVGLAQASECVCDSMTCDVTVHVLLSPTAMYRWGHLEVVKYLTSKQHCILASSDQNGRTPLHLACQ